MSHSWLRLEGDGALRRLVLDRPERHNAQNPALWRELRAAGEELVADPAVRCVVLAGAGPSFSSGLDLAELSGDGFIAQLAVLPAEQAVARIEEAQRAFTWIRRAPFPVVAAVHGVAVGAGLQLALACDLRIVTSTARLALRETRLGVLPDLGATAWLPRIVGLERALDLILTGRDFTGADAVAYGLALRAVPEADLDHVVTEYASGLAELSRTALAHAKAATHEPDEARSLSLAAIGQARCVRERFGGSA
jgi:enoyl-CoA hydratase/carnithine racemase